MTWILDKLSPMSWQLYSAWSKQASPQQAVQHVHAALSMHKADLHAADGDGLVEVNDLNLATLYYSMFGGPYRARRHWTNP